MMNNSNIAFLCETWLKQDQFQNMTKCFKDKGL